MPRLLGTAIVVAIGIFLLLQAAFESWRLAFVAFLTLPSALVGGVLAAFLSGGVISLGYAGRTAPDTGDCCAQRHRDDQSLSASRADEEGETFGPELVLRGARERLAPIVMTALATGLVLLPMAIAGDIPGLEIVHPIAVVILGGLVTSTLLGLFILPTLYLRFGSSHEVVTESAPEPAPSSELAPGVMSRKLSAQEEARCKTVIDGWL